MRTLTIEGDEVILKVDDKKIRYTKLSYLPEIPEGLEGKELAEWGIAQDIDGFAVLPFELFLDYYLDKIDVYTSHNGEYKIIHLGYTKGFTSKIDAEEYLSSLLGREETIDLKTIYKPGDRKSILDSISYIKDINGNYTIKYYTNDIEI